jgi:hypothetical protein
MKGISMPGTPAATVGASQPLTAFHASGAHFGSMDGEPIQPFRVGACGYLERREEGRT